jgi:hypothetical protein
MATQTRVPGAASSEVDFELERFERTGEDRIEIAGRWYGLRGRRFVRPVLNLHTGAGRRRAIALLEHKPWAATDGQTWLAAFAWPDGTADVKGAELEVGPGLVVELPALGGTPNTAGRVSALRPHVPAPPPLAVRDDRAGHGGAARDGGAGEGAAAARAGDGWPADRSGRRGGDGGAADRAARDGRSPQHDPDAAAPRDRYDTPSPQRRDSIATALAERDEAIAARDDAESERITALVDRDDALSRRDAALRDVDRAVAERDEAVAERDRVRGELERITRERDHAHAERNRALQDIEVLERDRDQAAAERDAARSELSRALPARDQALRERDAEATRADRAESERDTAFAERKSAVAQRDRARRERDRAMRAAGVDPPVEDPHVTAAPLAHRRPPAGSAADDGAAADGASAPVSERPAAVAASDVGRPAADAGSGDGAGRPAADAEDGDGAGRPAPDAGSGDGAGRPAPDAGSGDRAGRPAVDAESGGGTPGYGSPAGRDGAALASRPLKRIGAAAAGPADRKPLLTPVDGSRPRRLSRTRRTPSAPVRWAVRVAVVLLLIAVALVAAILLGRVL